MFCLTKQEKIVLIILSLVLLAGSAAHFIFYQYPQLKDIVNLLDSSDIYHKVDINTASTEELVDIPYIGEFTAGKIMEYRRQKGSFRSLEEVKSIPGIREKNYQKFSAYLTISKQR